MTDVDEEEEDATGTDVFDATSGGPPPAKPFWTAAFKWERALDDEEDDVDVVVVRLKSWGDPKHFVSGTPAYLQLLGVAMAPPRHSKNERNLICESNK